jgi:DnaK suppressor protein
MDPSARITAARITAERIAAERAVTLRRLAALNGTHEEVVAASLDTNADDEHDPEGATIAFERSQIAALVLQTEHHLAELDAAEARVQDGTYGTCESCDTEIAPERLEARPTARVCIDCASRPG